MIIRLQLPPQSPLHHSSSSFQTTSPKPYLIPNSKRPLNSHKGFTPLKTLSPYPLSPLLTENPCSDSGLLFRQKLLYLENLNINSTKALDLNPNIRSSSLESIQLIEECLYSMGIQQSDIGRILDMYPKILTCDVENDLYPVFYFLLNNVHIPFYDIRKTIIKCPRLLVCSVDDQLKPALCFLQGLGFVGGNKITSQTALLLVSNVEGTLIPKIDYLQSLGFLYKEAVTMVLRSPRFLTFSLKNNLQPKVKYFLEEMKGDLVELKRFPQYFSYSLERKIKPRHLLLVDHGFSLPLSEMLKVSDGQFESRFVQMRLQSADKKLLG
ncbi:Transcription termination factor mtef1 protein [Thalictrum thalictroides]|uniref:Transcription termination factor mtef1 protein n=1 Tax=Thalictrum thalictroides TaxID=46969 RepID=A0A7J6VB64_THATH|nr:Transcription termination factor mtef1 protein [Thalictrum thalictroides]